MWNAEQALQFLEGARGSRHYLIYRVLLETGLRLGEALPLMWSDKDFANSVLVVREGKTENARRALKLSHELLGDLRTVRGVGLVFYSARTGATFDDDSIRDAFYKLIERLGLPRIRLHDLRHLNASLNLQEGVDIATVSARLGHASKSFTLQQYAHAMPAGQEKAAELVSQLTVRNRAFQARAAGSTTGQNPLH